MEADRPTRADHRDDPHTMTIRVRCFGPAARSAGATFVPVEVSRPATAGDVLAALAVAVPALDPMLAHCAVAVHDEIVPRDRLVEVGSTLDLLPPVAGG